MQLLVAGFLLAHAAIHLSFLSPRPPARQGAPPWPFELERSWLLTPLGLGSGTTRPVGTAGVVLTVASFALAALVFLGVLPADLWVPALASGSVASLALLTLFFHRWLVLGLAINVALLWAVVVAGWQPPV